MLHSSDAVILTLKWLVMCVFYVGRAPDDETCLLVSTPNKALSQSFENLIDDNNLGLMTVRASFIT